MDNYKLLYDKFVKYKEAKEEGSRRVVSPLKNVPRSFCENIVKELSTIELVRNTNGKINVTDTVCSVTDPQTRGAFMLAFDVSRSEILGSTAAKNPEYASLTPLLMYAHKKYHKVNYNDWDRYDKNIKWALGKFLVSITEGVDEIKEIKTFLEDNPEELLTLRQDHLAGKPVNGYYGRKITCSAGSLIGNSPVAKMLFQTWIANVSIRVPGAMILDPIDWDNVPEALDLETEISTGLPW